MIAVKALKSQIYVNGGGFYVWRKAYRGTSARQALKRYAKNLNQLTLPEIIELNALADTPWLRYFVKRSGGAICYPSARKDQTCSPLSFRAVKHAATRKLMGPAAKALPNLLHADRIRVKFDEE
ncbi:hypothetical protein ACJ5NV_01535 [Loktanella agnita]|uniref:hypothetical protein n=1 Tax=Loktanella agnita TaxID=287097 RepID=UPI00398797FA